MSKSKMSLSLLLLAIIAPVLAEIETEFTRRPESVSAPLGDEIAFDCAVSVPAERMAWRRRPSPSAPWQTVDQGGVTDSIRISPPRSNTTTQSKLTIRIKDRGLAGEYQCVVWYGAIVLASVPARLSIAEMNLIDSSNRDTLVTAPSDNPIVLHCPPVESNPPAVFSWWKLSSGGIKKQLDSPYGVLVIAKAAAEDSGTYGCTASNEISGEARDLPGKVHLEIRREDVPMSTRFLEPAELAGSTTSGRLEARVLAGTALRLWCGAVGHPAPVVTWSRYGDRGKLPVKSRLDPLTQALVVPALETADEGDYECTAGGLRRSWRVVALSAARWRGLAEGARATEGGSAHIRCPASLGQPPPKITWMLNAEPLNGSDNVHIQGEDLYIQHVEKRHAGIVQCFATNELGAQYEAAILTVVPIQINGHDFPAHRGEKSTNTPSQPRRRNRKNKGKNKVLMIPPSRPNVTRMSDESAMVTWRADTSEGLPILFFKVQYRDLTLRSAWKTANTDIANYISSYEVDGLIPEHEYKFRIAAVYSNQDNKLGDSSGRFYLQRGQRGLRPPQAPLLVRVSPLSTTSVGVDWTWSQGSGPMAEGFYVYYRAVADAGNYAKVTAPGGARARHAELTHLDTDTPYDVKIQSYTAAAPSEFSAIKSVRTLRNTSAEVSTEAPAGGADTSSGADAAPPGAYTAGAAAGGAGMLLLGLALTLLLCRRRANTTKEKQPTPSDLPNSNGYLPSKVPITITANPLHAESDSMEMPYLHNNNCGGGATPPATPPPQLRKHNHLPAPPTVDYV